MNKIAIASLGALISLSALGQDLLQCVNPDVINSLLMTSREAPEFIVSSERPEQLAGFETPAGFAWIGSRHSSYDTRAAWRTDLEMESAVAAFTAAMTSAGITPLPDGDDSGFELTRAPLLSVVCTTDPVGVLLVPY
jgi:hypothetical protein